MKIKRHRTRLVGVFDNRDPSVIVILKLDYSSLQVEIVTDGVRPMCGF